MINSLKNYLANIQMWKLLILYIIAEAERKWVPTIKEVVTNKKKDPLKCCHIYSFQVKQPHVTTNILLKAEA